MWNIGSFDLCALHLRGVAEKILWSIHCGICYTGEVLNVVETDRQVPKSTKKTPTFIKHEHLERERERERERKREADRQTSRQTDREKQTERMERVRSQWQRHKLQFIVIEIF